MIDDEIEAAYRAMNTLTICEERLDTSLDEAMPLLQTHWQELASYPDIPVAIDRDLYTTLEARGHLCVITARVEHKIVGYAVFFVLRHPHYDSLQAQEDIIYLAPALRRQGLGTQLLEASDRILRSKGVQVVHHHVKLAHPALGVLLQRHGYDAVETIYSKRLDKD